MAEKTREWRRKRRGKGIRKKSTTKNNRERREKEREAENQKHPCVTVFS